MVSQTSLGFGGGGWWQHAEHEGIPLLDWWHSFLGHAQGPVRPAVPVLLETERRITEAGLSQVSSGLLPAGTVLLSSRAPIGYLAIAEVPVAINQGFIAMKPKNGVSNLFLLAWAKFANDEIVSRANGSTFLEISKTSFRLIPVVSPPEAVMNMFDEYARPLYQRLVTCVSESKALTSLRDTLLPKLVSGELRVKDAERFVAAAT